MNDRLPSTTNAHELRAWAWNQAVLASPGELELDIDAAVIEGTIPAALRGGRLLSNGPGWTQLGTVTLHPFDGHGYARAFELRADGSCHLRARFIQTRIYRDEAAAGRMLYRGLATNLPGRPWRSIGFGPPRNVANTTITRWGDRLLAGWEGGEPHALDADSLATAGTETFGGVIAGLASLAHMRRDHAQGRLLLCSVAGHQQPTFRFRELDAHDRVVHERAATLDSLCFAHDFAFTPNHYVLGGNPLRLRPAQLAKVLLGRSTMLQAIASDERQPGLLHLIPRSGDGPVRSVRLPAPAMVIHFGNAFERDGDVIVDACVFRHYAFGHELGYTGPHTPLDPALPDARSPQQLVRITVPAGASEATWSRLTPHGVDFPRFHPDHEGRETPWLFGATRADTRHSDPFDSIIAIDLRDPERPAGLWTAPEQVFVGEPIFVPDPARDDAGHVLAVLSDPLRARSLLAIFDAAQLAAGPLASVPLPLLPVGFHGDWDA